MNWTRITRTIAPATRVLTLTEVKTHLNVTHDDEDIYLTSLIDTATAMVDGPAGIGLAMVHQSYRASADALDKTFSIPLTPVSAITSITYLDSEGESVTVEPSTYRLDGDSKPARVFLDEAITDAKAGTVKVTFVAGFGDEAADVPQDLRHALLMVLTGLYEGRDGMAPASLSELPYGVRSIFARYGVPA